jgi:hypothetical protein
LGVIAGRFGYFGGLESCDLLGRRLGWAPQQGNLRHHAGTLPGVLCCGVSAGKFERAGCSRRGKGNEELRHRSVSAPGLPLIPRNIIGHRVSSYLGNAPYVIVRGSVFSTRLVLLLFHQQAREPGIRAFFHVRIQQLLDFLPNLRAVIKSRQFIALQGISGRREQKISRRLGCFIAS